MSLATSLFDYALPPELIAQSPAGRREESRLLVVNRSDRTLAHKRFTDLPQYLRTGDMLFRNNAAVLPARLIARRPTGGRVECFLLRPEAVGSRRWAVGGSEAEEWRCLIKPGRKLGVGERFSEPNGGFEAEIAARHEDGSATVRFTIAGGESVTAMAARVGHVPLPPYIDRDDTAGDRDRYQTVYADPNRTVAVAAPTAGLHFTKELNAELAKMGVGFADLTLHVGIGTFRPISTEVVEEHPIHREWYEIPASTVAALSTGKRRVAVGTTSVRAIEDYIRREGSREAGALQEASIFIYPPHPFRGVDALLTNFHLPRSTLLCLVAAFLSPGNTDGVGWLQEIYAEAIRERYRFLSYGDAMLIV